jgi:hypothetical protein
MKGLEKYLVQTILGEAAQMDKVVVVYSGRFQPFHKGHYATYDNLIKKFGKDSVYIGTSDVTDNKKSPFGFKEKKAIMMKMFGIPSNKIFNVRNPYAPQEILNKFDSDTTGFITVVGEKDSSRLSGKYFTPYKGKVEQGYLDKGYVYASPAQPNAISGTDVRYWLSSGSEMERKKNFTKAYPKFDDQIFKLITLKLKGLKECINEEIKLNVNIGDTLLMGKFKNKKVVVKSIGKDEWGMPTINGKKAVTFRIPKKEELKEAASTGGFTGKDEPDTSFVADGQPRILNTAKPEGWYKQGGYTQMHTPKADAMRGRGKSKDTETQFRKAYYKLKNVTQSTLNPADDPFKVEDWQDVYRENPNEKPKRFWEMPENQKDTIISKEDINEIMDNLEEEMMSEMGLGGGAGVGLSLPGGYINGAPDPKDVKKMKSKLDKDGSEEYTPVKEAFTKGQIFAGKMKVGGKPVNVEVELVGSDNKTNQFITKIIYVDKGYERQLPIGSTLPIPARIFRTPGGGWRKIKTPSVFEMAKADMDAVEKYADQQFAPSDIELGKETDHFFQRLNDPRNGKEISPAELTGFFKRLAKNKKKFLEFVKQYKEFVVKDRRTDINIPFVVMANKLIAKTIMRKADFKSITPVFTTEIDEVREGGLFWQDILRLWYDNKNARGRINNYLLPNEKHQHSGLIRKKLEKMSTDDVEKMIKTLNLKTKNSIGVLNIYESLLLEGGAYGHMNHPFDIQMNLTFGDLKNIVTKALNGDLELAREKTDGQALAISWVNGRLVAARNKSHLKNKGEGAMTIGQVATNFANRGALTDAYTFAMKDLSAAVSALSEPQKKKIFKDGACFMNLEVIYPKNANVIPYGQNLLVFHGTFEYDESGEVIGENQQAASILAGMIKQVNKHVQSTYTIQGPPMLSLPKSEELTKKQGKYISMINKLQSEYKLSDSAGVADYHQAYWTDLVNKNAKGLDAQQKIGLVKRWAFGDKGFRIATIQDAKIKAWADNMDKKDQAKISKENIMKFEEIFLGVGADVLAFVQSVLTANPSDATKKMRAELGSAIKSLKATGTASQLDKLKIELQRLNSLGGFDKIVPNEGLVFVYNGNTYKLTGAFAPLNQILGIFKFSR